MVFKSVKDRIKNVLLDIDCIYSSISIYRKSLSTKGVHVNNLWPSEKTKKSYALTHLPVRVCKCLQYLYNEAYKGVVPERIEILRNGKEYQRPDKKIFSTIPLVVKKSKDGCFRNRRQTWQYMILT